MGDLPNFHKAPKVNESFFRLLDKPVSSSRYVALSLVDAAQLEACIRGQIESQSFSLWVLVAVFDHLKDANCVSDDDLFSQLVSSMTTAINSQAKASFSCGLFAAEEARDLGVSSPECDSRVC